MTIDGGAGGGGAPAADSKPSADDAGDDDDPKKMFFTTSDLVARMNSAMEEVGAGGAVGGGGFELQRKMPDGSYRRAEEGETAAVDFQAKMKQASAGIAGLDPSQRIEWAQRQRKEGNALFAKGEFKEAMDVYLTCLVAMDQTSSSSDEENLENAPSAKTGGASGGPSLDDQIETEIKLPVLLNLALCALRLGTPSRAEKFCDFALETGAGQRSAKAHFRRGCARVLMGRYTAAGADLDRALALTDERSAAVDNDVAAERAAILREQQKLGRLARRAERDRRRQKRAMEKLFQSGASDGAARGDESAEGATGLYPEMRGPKEFPTRRNDDGYVPDDRQLTWFEWYRQMIGRGAQKLLDIIGEDDEEETVDLPIVDMPVDQFMPLEGRKGKKDA